MRNTTDPAAGECHQLNAQSDAFGLLRQHLVEQALVVAWSRALVVALLLHLLADSEGNLLEDVRS